MHATKDNTYNDLTLFTLYRVVGVLLGHSRCYRELFATDNLK